MKPIEGEPAFPSPPVGTGDPRDGMTTGSPGMSLRQYYIGQALAGICANPESVKEDFAYYPGEQAIKQVDHLMSLLYPQQKETNQ